MIMNWRRIGLAAGIGAVLGALWWGVRELIASGAVCSTDDFDCLGVGVISMPVAVVVGGVLGWLALRALHEERPAWAAGIGVVLAAVFMILTVWIAVPAGAIVTGALGFALGAAVTGTRRVSETAARD
ncbi:hypothetical protein [Umezawaea sp. NPDC059074]|uniref:hypothetical protein n=1 Tax=Umezawaea sp. NPDC059074 TaxID=3346716 RepID=UPI0036799F89